MPELAKDCIDMTNASSTYLGIVGGAAIGAIYCNESRMSKRRIEGF
jgi:hypothetical protein